jgi:hypothetical protein
MSSKLFENYSINEIYLWGIDKQIRMKSNNCKTVITSNDKDIGKVDDIEEFEFIMKIFYI